MFTSITMTRMMHLTILAVCALMLTACSTTKPVAYSGIASAPLLTHNLNDESGRVPYSYTPVVDWEKYHAVILEPVVVYRGSDQQFGELSEVDKNTLAQYMQSQFSEKLATRFTLSNTVTPATLRVRITLTGAVTNTPVLGTLSRFDLAGGIYNGVQTARDREGTLTGSVIYCVEVFRAQDNRLLNAFITKQYPSPWNLSASMGALAASKAGIEKGAQALVAQLQ